MKLVLKWRDTASHNPQVRLAKWLLSTLWANQVSTTVVRDDLSSVDVIDLQDLFGALAQKGAREVRVACDGSAFVPWRDLTIQFGARETIIESVGTGVCGLDHPGALPAISRRLCMEPPPEAAESQPLCIVTVGGIPHLCTYSSIVAFALQSDLSEATLLQASGDCSLSASSLANWWPVNAVSARLGESTALYPTPTPGMFLNQLYSNNAQPVAVVNATVAGPEPGRPTSFDVAAFEGKLRALVLDPGADVWKTVAALFSSDCTLSFDVEARPIRGDDRQGSFLTAIPTTSNLVLRPSTEGVSLCVGEGLRGDDLTGAILHGLGHVLLGHVRPGDEHGHWDTLESIRGTGRARRWDRDVRKAFPGWFEEAEVVRKVTQLAECTPLEKAQLGLWQMIGEMLGESRQLHPEAVRYQQAAYQRQAAQRLLAQLEEYGGCMLCDGVGLGKTYIATTLMVHFANTWRDRFQDDPDVVLTDPFRITVLAPNSVVSTWQREAIPPLASHGVPLPTVRVISHTKLSRIGSSSAVLERTSPRRLSDLEHLLLSDLVIVDEAHNFRSLQARRTKVLRDLLRLQPRKSQRRRVALLTATPLNNSLEDLRQEVSLLFSRSTWLSDARTDDGYRNQAVTEIKRRCKRARGMTTRADLANFLVLGSQDARFSDALDFRDDLDFGPHVQRIGDYLREQDKLLKAMQEAVRGENGAAVEEEKPGGTARIADELLDRIVVQRSRALCKEIEIQHGSDVELLFRKDADLPEKLTYSDEYDGISDVLASFLPLFEKNHDEDVESTEIKPLTLKVYMWYDVREGFKTVDDSSPVVGLQRILVLKRLESSPVSFLLTLLRLTALHAVRLEQLRKLCQGVGDTDKLAELDATQRSVLEACAIEDLAKLHALATGERDLKNASRFVPDMAEASTSSVTDSELTELSDQLGLFFDDDDEEVAADRDDLERLWPLHEPLLRDFSTLLRVTPGLADIVFGRFSRDQWPRRFVAGGEAVDWPESPEWGMRLVTDEKLRRLVNRLLEARRQGQKVIVFSQFKDTLAYVHSVLRACATFGRQEWTTVVHALDVPSVKADEVQQLLAVTEVVTGDTEGRDDAVNAFAPYYRIGPSPPATEGTRPDEALEILEAWRESWRRAIRHPVEVLLSTDVLAEGVNLQDVAVLINYDVHWNPVRMIQRSGRIDRRLSPAVETTRDFSELETIAREIGGERPAYYWHGHADEAPLTVNLILPDELEAELLLRERIALKTLAIDLTLGLEHGTGAEADWMEDYVYHGVASLNAFRKDRAIERIGSYHERLSKEFEARGIELEWLAKLNGWFRARDATEGSPLVGRAQLGRAGGESEVYTRYLEPKVVDGVSHWLWSQEKPSDSLLNFWIALDNETWPPAIRQDISWSPSASLPLSAEHLLRASLSLVENLSPVDELEGRQVGRPLQQGMTALAAGFFDSEEDRRHVRAKEFFVLQLPTVNWSVQHELTSSGGRPAANDPKLEDRPT